MKLGHSECFRPRTFYLAAGAVGFVLSLSQASADPGVALHLEIDRTVASVPGAPAIRPADDAEFLRRVTLDLTGQIPSGVVVGEFVMNREVDKRAVQIERLLDSPAYARHMQQVFDTWLMQRHRERHVPADQWHAYLQESFASNKPWDQLAIEILGSDGTDPHPRAAAKFYLDRECNTDELARDISGIFLGRNLRCAQCHDHPIVPDYKQAHFFGIAAFVDRSFLFDDKVRKQKVLAEKGEGETTFTSALTQVRGVTTPRILDGPPFPDPVVEKDAPIVVSPVEGIRPTPIFSRRAQLPAAVVQHSAFSRNMANRLWALLFGRGIVEPVDLDHEANPPIHPELLQLLSERFVQMKYDIRAFLRELALTELYGSESSSIPSGDGRTESQRPCVALTLRKLTPEQLAWSWLQATGQFDAELQLLMSELRTSDPKMITILAASRSTQEVVLHVRLAVEAEKVIKVFVTSLPGEAPRSETTTEQALYLLNGQTLRKWIGLRPGNLLDRLMHEMSEDRMAQDLFLNVVSRPPNGKEVCWVRETLATSGAERVTTISDLIEALLTSTEFRFNH